MFLLSGSSKKFWVPVSNLNNLYFSALAQRLIGYLKLLFLNCSLQGHTVPDRVEDVQHTEASPVQHV